MQKQQEKHTIRQEKCNVFGPVATVFASSNTGTWRLERPSVDYKSCVKCGTCAKFCPAHIITVVKDAEECIQFDWDICKGCGICANECPKKCIAMIPEGGEE